ncbi:hypothetical protein OUZ56_031995 [Daphnia magna]|uniref:Uncharacterized protein n=1 Tax=Daphnia magna TaxID=35525 RepID=A0ABQ9ZVX5_9CRUS|nr:hypothetical protein OUZ56_031995 [Daphnia magna]
MLGDGNHDVSYDCKDSRASSVRELIVAIILQDVGKTRQCDIRNGEKETNMVLAIQLKLDRERHTANLIQPNYATGRGSVTSHERCALFIGTHLEELKVIFNENAEKLGLYIFSFGYQQFFFIILAVVEVSLCHYLFNQDN